MPKYDNIIVPSDGRPPVRIDSGGALTYRAMGGIKKFEMIPNEIHSMRMVGVQAGTIFGNITDNELAKQIKERLLPYHDAILNVTPEDLKHVIKKRIEFMNRWAEDILKGVIRKAGKRTNKQNRKIRKTRKTRKTRR